MHKKKCVRIYINKEIWESKSTTYTSYNGEQKGNRGDYKNYLHVALNSDR